MSKFPSFGAVLMPLSVLCITCLPWMRRVWLRLTSPWLRPLGLCGFWSRGSIWWYTRPSVDIPIPNSSHTARCSWCICRAATHSASKGSFHVIQGTSMWHWHHAARHWEEYIIFIYKSSHKYNVDILPCEHLESIEINYCYTNPHQAFHRHPDHRTQ